MSLDHLLHARSVAIVGISHPGRFGGLVYTNMRDFGYDGHIYGVNPRYETLHGQPCYPSLSELPEKPQLAVLAVPNRALLPAFEEMASLGIRAAVIYGSAHSENGDPRSTERAIAEMARQHEIDICGPNCMGFLSFGKKLVVSGYPVVPGTPAGHITCISHSGSVFDSMWQNNRQIHFNYVISSGNETATTMADYMRFSLKDPSTRVIALFLETVRDPAGFRTALAEAAERDVPVVVFKVGRSARGAELARSHSGALAGNDTIYDALFAHYGVRRVRSLDEFMDTLELFSTGWRPHPRAIAATLDSGGERGMLVDMAEEIGVPFAEINAETRDSLTKTLDPGLEPTNPLDAWGTGNEIDRIYRDSLLALDSDPATGFNIFNVDLMRDSNLPPTYTDIVLPALKHFKKPLVFMVNVSASASESHMAQLRSAGVPVLMGTETGLRAVRHLFDYCAFREAQADGTSLEPGPPPPVHPEPAAAFASPLQLLAGYGLAIAPERTAGSPETALAAAGEIGYPVALKTANPAVHHKTDAGGLVLDIRDSESLLDAYQTLESKLGPEVVVQKMMPAGVELILGLVSDPQFGLFLSIGLGGIFVEVLKDVRLLALPASEREIRAALRGLKGAALLAGVRGRPPVDEDAIVRAALSLSVFASEFGERIREVDVNPLIAYPDGAVAVDGLIIWNENSP